MQTGLSEGSIDRVRHRVRAFQGGGTASAKGMGSGWGLELSLSGDQSKDLSGFHEEPCHFAPSLSQSCSCAIPFSGNWILRSPSRPSSNTTLQGSLLLLNLAPPVIESVDSCLPPRRGQELPDKPLTGYLLPLELHLEPG